MSAVEVFGPEAFSFSTGCSEAQLDDVQRFKELLGEWNKRMNLVGPSAMSAFWQRHAWDSAQLFHVERSATVWADVGAGAGFPGIMLAIMLKGRMNAQVHLIESMAKRVGFLDVVASELDLPVTLHHGRAEDLKPPPSLEMITARACAPFARLFDYTNHFFAAGARGLFLKGRDAEAELTEAHGRWTFEAELITSKSDPSGRLVRIERLAPRAR